MRLNSAATCSPLFSFAQNSWYSGELGVGRVDEHAVVLALDLFQAVAERLEKILVGGDDLAVEGEFDHRLGARDRVDLAGVLCRLQFGGGDVGARC